MPDRCYADAYEGLQKQRDTDIELKGLDVSCRLVMPERTRAELTSALSNWPSATSSSSSSNPPRQTSRKPPGLPPIQSKPEKGGAVEMNAEEHERLTRVEIKVEHVERGACCTTPVYQRHRW